MSGLTNEKRLQMLEWREGILDIVLDTDAATEVDDPFAISYLLLSPERFCVHAIYAAPFAMNERAQEPMVGMEMSYCEIRHIMELCRLPDACPVFHGSDKWIFDKNKPIVSEATADLIKRAMTFSPDNPLYVLALGAGTNIASALIQRPEIAERIVVVWLAGDDLDRTPNVYNIYQDVKAAQIIFDSGVPLIHVPCKPVTSHMITGIPELESCIGGKNHLCDYLIESVMEYGQDHFAWGKTIWDLGAAGILMKREWSNREYISAPIITDQITWSRDINRHLMANIKELNRDAIFRDAFRKMGTL